MLVKVAVWGPLVVPGACDPKERLTGEMFAADVGTTSYTPRSTAAPAKRGLPSKSVLGIPVAELLPAFTAGDAACKWKSLFAGLMKRGSAEMLPGFEVLSQTPAQAEPEAANASL